MDLFAKKTPEKSLKSQQIKTQVADLLALDEEATVMVTELTCQEDGCPELETVIAVFQPGRPKVQIKLRSGIEEIAIEDIARSCRSLEANPQQAEVTPSNADENDHTS